MEDPTRLNPVRRTRRRWMLAALCVWLAVILAGLMDAASATDPATDELVHAAREAASQDRHKDAEYSALKAIAADPSLEPHLALLVANQMIWQDRPVEALLWYQKHLQHHPGDRDGRLGLARALSWSDRLPEAKQEYSSLIQEDASDAEALVGAARMDEWAGRDGGARSGYRTALDADPDSREARLGLARVQNRLGRHRWAERELASWLKASPEDEEARTELARARYWMGEGDAALETLDGSPDPGAADLRGVIRNERRTRVDAFFSRWIDVDDQEVEIRGVRWERGLSRDVTLVGEVAQNIVDEPGIEPVESVQVMGGGGWRLDRRLAVNLRARWDKVGGNLSDTDSLRAGAGETRVGADVKSLRFHWQTWAAWTPRDRTRFDLAYSRSPVYTPVARVRDIRADVISFGVDQRVGGHVVAHASLAYGDYSDGNVRIAEGFEISTGPWRIAPSMRGWLNVGVLRYDFDESPDHGYYSPSSYDAGYLATELGIDVFRTITLEVDARVGSEREEDSDRFGVANGGFTLTWRPPAPIGVSLFARTSTSRFDTDAGYEREGFGISVFVAP